MGEKLWALVAAATLAALLWFLPVKLLFRARRRQGRTIPCPHQFGWLLDHRFRRWCYRNVLDRLALAPGATVLDVGAGTGTFTLPAARRVAPAGRVIAIDVQQAMIDKLRRRLAREGVSNVEPHVASACDLPVVDGSVDVALIIGALGEVPDQHRALAEVYRVLKPGGQVSITETFFDPDYNWPKELTRLLEELNFTVTGRKGGFWLYTLNAAKYTK